MKLFEKTARYDEGKIRTKICGITLYEHRMINDNSIKKILYGLIKIKKTIFKKTIYFLGIKIYSKTLMNPKELELFNRIDCQINSLKSDLLKDIRQIVIDETRMANAVMHLHSQVFPKFKNCNTNKDVVIVGTGPSLNFYEFNKNFVHVGLNKAFLAENIKKLDYIFAIDYFAVKNFIEELKKYDCVKFIGKQSNINLELINSQSLQSTFIPQKVVDIIGALSFYGDAHREKYFPDIETCPLMDRGSIAFPALHFTLYTAPKRIFLVGCDTSHNGYYDNSKDNSAWRLLDMALDGYVKFKEFAQIYYPQIEIISVNPVGLKGLFKDVYTKSYVAKNPELFNEIENIVYFEDFIKEGVNA